MISPEISHLLYEDESGETIGLDEVQLLRPVPTQRIAPLRALLEQPDLGVTFQATLVPNRYGKE